ncbi:CHAT domain-containing protein [Mycena rebaudengoi]|nr:CHAT domain-containing protein [Mycena rebaudengoi]
MQHPTPSSYFLSSFLHQSETEGTRLLGHVEIRQDEVLGSVESNRCTIELKFNRVNPDGPSLKSNTGFSVGKLPYQEVPGLDVIDMPEHTIASVMGGRIRSELQQMHEDSRKPQFSIDALERWVMHERILLCYQSIDNRAQCLNILGDILLQSYQASGNVDDLNQAVRDDSGTVIYLADLGRSLRHRFERCGHLLDINRSAMMLEAAVERTLQGDSHKPSGLNDLGNSLFRRLSDLAISMIPPNGHPDKPLWLSNLGHSLKKCFERLGELNDLNQSILRSEAAVTLTPDDHLDKPSWLSNLGNSLLRCFELLGDLDDLNQSVLWLEAAVALTPDGHPDKPSLLNTLGNSLSRRFEQLGDLNDLTQCVSRLEAAIALTPDGHPNKPSQLSKLGNSLLGCFKQLVDLDDLNQSVLRLEAAVALTPDGHPDKPSLLNNLGNLLSRRIKRLGDHNDLTQSVSRLEPAVTLAPNDNPDKPTLPNNLGNSLHQQFEQFQDPQDSQQLWAKNAHIHEPSSILHAYTTAIELLPELAWLGLSITDRHHHLSHAGQVVRDAATAAIAVHDYKKAVEWLDQGRSVIWGQLLNLRTPVDELKKSHPNLAARFVSLSTALETAGTRTNAVPDAVKPQSFDFIGQQSHDLALARDHVLQQIRELPGFKRFLTPKPFSELLLAAKMGPVVILNISAYACDALILMPDFGDEVIHVPLSDFTIHEAQAFAKVLASIVGTPGRSDRSFGFHKGDMAPDDIFSHILSVLWFKIVHPILSALAITTPVSQDLGRIWWCPTGPLSFLPIHAAGLYGGDQTLGSKLSDFLISSYTPSLTALIHAFRPHPESQAELQLLAITQTSAKGQSYLPGTQEEVECIQEHARGKVRVRWLDEEMATIDEVQKGMMNSGWVHFACHGVQSDSPTESALLLGDSSRLTLSKTIRLLLPNADLAFLSACQTATGSQELQDESVHLIAGMLLAGCRGVIGTMWSIDDNDAPQVAGDVYVHLLEESPPDPTRAAQALHLAVQRLREQPGPNKSFLHWVPFIHFGV